MCGGSYVKLATRPDIIGCIIRDTYQCTGMVDVVWFNMPGPHDCNPVYEKVHIGCLLPLSEDEEVIYALAGKFTKEFAIYG